MQQKRGKELREEIIKSEEKGIDYRISHQGADTVKPDKPGHQSKKDSK